MSDNESADDWLKALEARLDKLERLERRIAELERVVATSLEHADPMNAECQLCGAQPHNHCVGLCPPHNLLAMPHDSRGRGRSNKGR